MNRRSLFKYLSAAIVAAPFMLTGSAQAAECGIVPPEQKFIEKALNCGGDIGLPETVLPDIYKDLGQHPVYPYPINEGVLPQQGTNIPSRDASLVTYWGTGSVTPKIRWTPPSASVPISLYDPMGQVGSKGILSWKIALPNGLQYGNWLEVGYLDWPTDYKAQGAVLAELSKALRENMNATMDLVAPNIAIKWGRFMTQPEPLTLSVHKV